MKIEGYKEISWKEYNKLPASQTGYFYDHENNTKGFFKKAQKFPICFEMGLRDKIHIDSDGSTNFYHNDKLVFFIAPDEIPILVKVVEKAKEVAKKNEK